MGWANKLLGWSSNNGVEVSAKNSLYVTEIPGGNPSFCVATKTGLIGAAAAAGAAVFAMRIDPGAGAVKAYIESIKLRFTTTTAFTTPITATRSIVISRGSGAASSGGTGITTATPKDTVYPASEFDLASGGDIRVATTAALTVTGITWGDNIAEIPLIHVGAAGAFYEHTYEFSVRNHPFELNAGQVLGIRVGSSAMDAAGVWVLGIEVAWQEGSNYS